jgi:hypothetical protein
MPDNGHSDSRDAVYCVNAAGKQALEEWMKRDGI